MLAAVLDLAHPEQANCEWLRHEISASGRALNPNLRLVTMNPLVRPRPSRLGRSQWLAEGHSLLYVTGNFLQKYLRRHSCMECKGRLTSDRQTCTEIHELFTYLKAYNTNPDKPGEFGSLTIPSEDFSTIFLYGSSKLIRFIVEAQFSQFAHLQNPCSTVLGLVCMRDVGMCSSISANCVNVFQKCTSKRSSVLDCNSSQNGQPENVVGKKM